MNSSTHIIPSRPGMALPMTIIAVAGLTLLLVGLLTVLTLERKTARSYSDSARADLAVESGLAVALGTITEIARRDDSIVFRIEDPVQPTVAVDKEIRPLEYREQFFTYGALYENGMWRGIPLFSAGAEIPLGTRKIDANLLKPVLSSYLQSSDPILKGNKANPVFSVGRPTEHDQGIPRAKWVEVPSNPSDSNDYTMRYAYWVEDLSGRIDGKLAASEPRTIGQSTAELPLFSFFGETSTPSPPQQVKLVSNQKLLRTSGSTRTLLGEDSKLIEPYIYYGFPQIDPATPRPPATVPFGFGYRDAGTVAKDLNSLVANSDVQGIVDVISGNLPDFEATRKGGFPNTDSYTHTIAASIIDYADTNSNPTTGDKYRGIDSYPFVNQITDRYLVLPPPATNPKVIRLQCRTFIELWNPSNQTISGRVQLENVNNVGITAGGPRMMTPRRLRTNPVLAPVSLAPNEHKVLEMFNDGTSGEAVVYEWTSGVTTVPPYVAIGSTSNNYELYWNNILVDKARSASQFDRAQGNPSIRETQNNAYGSGNCPELEPSAGVPGDPRSSWYLTRRVRPLNYEDNTSWGGRNILTNINKPMLVSPDPAYSGIPGWQDRGSNFPLGRNPGSRANIPGSTSIINATTLAPVANKSYLPNREDMAPTRISNLGYYLSLAELGNIFDPAQWSDVDSAAGSSSSEAGGGISLAIGRPEYAKFDTEGRRAAQLLDLFSIVPPSGSLAVTPSYKLNINTASRDALRALVAGIMLNADTVTNAKPPQADKVGDLFADSVIAARNLAPLRSLSDLSTIRTPGTNLPFFGNRQVYPDATRPPDSWSDVGREELFLKIVNLVAFQGKFFRITVAGQSIGKSGEVISTSRREFHVSVEPARNADGTLNTAVAPVVRKLFETTL